jgi:hypothetical protein
MPSFETAAAIDLSTKSAVLYETLRLVCPTVQEVSLRFAFSVEDLGCRVQEVSPQFHPTATRVDEFHWTWFVRLSAFSISVPKVDFWTGGPCKGTPSCAVGHMGCKVAPGAPVEFKPTDSA